MRVLTFLRGRGDAASGRRSTSPLGARDGASDAVCLEVGTSQPGTGGRLLGPVGALGAVVVAASSVLIAAPAATASTVHNAAPTGSSVQSGAPIASATTAKSRSRDLESWTTTSHTVTKGERTTTRVWSSPHFRREGNEWQATSGQVDQWHPGSPRHFGGDPYWKVSSGAGGTVRFPQ